MFGLIKNTLKDNLLPTDGAKLAELYAGCVVGFGFMPQNNIRGKRIPVTEINSYLFDSDSFIAYRLMNNSADINLIVAEGDGPTETYLALSQRIEQRFFESLFASSSPHKWLALKAGDTVTVKPPAMGALQGWLVSRYTLGVSMKGRFMEGDYRLRKAVDRSRFSRPFDYVLLIDEDNKYALELEKYDDGTLNVFATIYRPVTDIGEIVRGTAFIKNTLTRPSDSKPLSAAKEDEESKSAIGLVQVIPHVSPREMAKERNMSAPTPIQTQNESTISSPPLGKKFELSIPAAPVLALQKDTIPASIAMPKPEKAEVKPSVSALKEKASAPSPLPHIDIQPATPVMHSKFGRIQPSSAPAQENDTLNCDVRLAARLIDEAQRNQIALSELIRKVIDLPAQVQDQVLIPFALNPAESAELARRYHLPAHDTQGLKEKILEELKRFAGEKN